MSDKTILERLGDPPAWDVFEDDGVAFREGPCAEIRRAVPGATDEEIFQIFWRMLRARVEETKR